MITNKDNLIFDFCNKYGGITINQCAKIFYNKNKTAYDTARIRLKKLYDKKQIKRYYSSAIDEMIYFTMNKKPSAHSILSNSIYAELKSIGADILLFEKEISFVKEYRHDAFIIFKYNNRTKGAIIETDLTHFTSQKKLDDVYESKILQNKYKNFPLVLVLCNSKRYLKSDNYTIIQSDIKCSDFIDKLSSIY